MKEYIPVQGKTVAIVAGGVYHPPLLSKIASADYVVGVDRGALLLLKKKLPLHLAIGDFDSVTAKEKRLIHAAAHTYIEYQPEKDMSDLELSVREVCMGDPKSVTLFAVLGNRFDHTMGAIHSLVYLSSHNIDGEIVDNFNKINIVRRGRVKFSRSAQFRYLSIMPLTQRAIVTLKGVKYPITKGIMHRYSSRGISNEIIHTGASVTVHQGTVLVIRSSDMARS